MGHPLGVPPTERTPVISRRSSPTFDSRVGSCITSSDAPGYRAGHRSDTPPCSLTHRPHAVGRSSDYDVILVVNDAPSFGQLAVAFLRATAVQRELVGGSHNLFVPANRFAHACTICTGPTSEMCGGSLGRSEEER
jgi:hypothetical protein